ncbi:PH domain-containing protein [Levilactobacillus namurensis]|uniref:PH domain-containing protein n=1 Tax=Levilactobacillus namurensis TaxID=380393 RepID=UPI0004657659|nr:PH domain-containing protein [Levilactobacillus namurensis]
MNKCEVDGQPIHIFKTGSSQLNDGWICEPHAKQAGFKSALQLNKYAKIATAAALKQALTDGINYKEKLDDIQNSASDRIKSQIKSAGIPSMTGMKKELAALPDIIDDKETITYAVNGGLKGNTVLMVCTNKRILFIDKGMVYGVKSTEIPLDSVNAVSYSSGMLLSKISVTNGATTTQIVSIPKNTAPIMVERIKEARDAYQKNMTSPEKSSSITDLRELKALLDDGILTQEEFNAKKKQILGI